jgi:hypothetical protein
MGKQDVAAGFYSGVGGISKRNYGHAGGHSRA